MQLLSRREVCLGRKCLGKIFAATQIIVSFFTSCHPGIPCSCPGKDGYGSHEAGALLSPPVRRAPLRAFLFSMHLLALKSRDGNGSFDC